jgi:hypothetical protein
MSQRGSFSEAAPFFLAGRLGLTATDLRKFIKGFISSSLNPFPGLSLSFLSTMLRRFEVDPITWTIFRDP